MDFEEYKKKQNKLFQQFMDKHNALFDSLINDKKSKYDDWGLYELIDACRSRKIDTHQIGKNKRELIDLLLKDDEFMNINIVSDDGLSIKKVNKSTKIGDFVKELEKDNISFYKVMREIGPYKNSDFLTLKSGEFGIPIKDVDYTKSIEKFFCDSHKLLIQKH